MTGRKTLSGRCVVLGVTGSIAAVETVKLAHALRRRGADVQAVMSAAACGIVTPDALAYASGRDVITRCTGRVEHVAYCGEGGCGDVLLIAPCTANTIGKIAAGIDDTPVTTFATTALGRGMPVVVAPAMHESMYRHPQVIANLDRLRLWGIDIVPPNVEEGKAKVADIESIVLFTERAILGKPLARKKVLITSGPCVEPVDDIRILTSRSTGVMGREIALEAFRLGAEVTVVHHGTFPCVTNILATSSGEMRDAVLRVLQEGMIDYYVSAAAISDFAPQQHQGKIPSGHPVDIHLEPLPKLLTEALTYHPATTIAFKLGWDERTRALALLDQGVKLVVLNTPQEMGLHGGTFTLLTREGEMQITGSKEEVAAEVWRSVQ